MALRAGCPVDQTILRSTDTGEGHKCDLNEIPDLRTVIIITLWLCGRVYGGLYSRDLNFGPSAAAKFTRTRTT